MPANMAVQAEAGDPRTLDARTVDNGVQTSHLHQPWLIGSRVRALRLASGLVLFAYVATHLLNHAVCNVSFAWADRILLAQKYIWQGVLGTTLLYASLTIHAALGLWALYARRHFRWTRAEALQLALGLAIPALLANHILATRGALTLFGLDKGYVAELTSLWITSPLWGDVQMAVLVVAWTHACIGLFFLLRLRAGFPAWQPALLALAVLVPVLALLGFAQGGREVARALAEPGFRAAHLGRAVVGTPASTGTLAQIRDDFLAGYGAAILLVLAARAIRRLAELRRGLVVVSYPGSARVGISPGMTVLDASRLGHIPHASVCGGKGRCSTCRVRVVWSDDPLPEPAANERKVLAGVGCEDTRIRLACQLRPGANLLVAPLISPDIAIDFVAGRIARQPSEERFVAAMFVDMRGSTWLAEHRTPFDSVFLLSRFIASVSDAVLRSGGRPVQFAGDGVLALFGLDSPPPLACQQALRAAASVGTFLEPVARLFEQETRRALRFGIGLHCGRVIVGEIGFARHAAFTAMGETVNIAHRLQELARDIGAEAVISEDVFTTGQRDPAGLPPHDAQLRGRTASLAVRLVQDGGQGEPAAASLGLAGRAQAAYVPDLGGAEPAG